MTDRKTVNYVVGGLAAGLLIAVVGIIALAMTDHVIPDILENLAIGALTALGAVLARTSSSDDVATPVTVVNNASDPVPTTEAAAPAVAAGALDPMLLPLPPTE